VGHETNRLYAAAAAETIADWDIDWHAWVKTPTPEVARETAEWLEKIKVLLAPPAPEAVTALETLRAVRNQVEKMFLEWRTERCGWEGLSEEVLGSDESGTARWLHHMLEDLDALVMRHEKALLGLISEDE